MFGFHSGYVMQNDRLNLAIILADKEQQGTIRNLPTKFQGCDVHHERTYVHVVYYVGHPVRRLNC